MRKLTKSMKMVRSDEALVNDVLNKYSHLIPNMGVLRCPPKESVKQEGFTGYSKMFCDSLIFWGLCNALDEKSKGTTTGMYIAEIRSVFDQSTLDVESIKTVSSGNLRTSNYDMFTREDRDELQRMAKDVFCAGYVAIKVALKDCKAKKVLAALETMLPLLKEKRIVIHDIDFTRDCGFVTSRMFLEKLMKEHDIRTVIDDRRRVGDHCFSWMGDKDDTKDIRYKVYNKLVQMLESAEVRKSLGSRIDELVAMDGSFSDRLLRHKDHGMSRLELTFYGTKLLPLSEYKRRMKDAMKLLKGCTTFECSFETQWRERAELIKSMVMIYIPKKQLFAYAHWWNAITSKKYGYMWKKVSRETSGNLLANYSFNDRPIHYLEARVDGDTISIVEEKTYKRVQGSTAMTLVPGGNKGMYPSRNSYPGGVRKFHEMGIVEVENIKIGWPKKTHTKKSAPLAQIVEVDDEGSKRVRELKGTSSSAYTAAHRILVIGEKYTIIAAGTKRYRDELRWHFVTQCGLQIRAGKSLTNIWYKWKKSFVGINETAPIRKAKWMTFMAVKTTSSRGVRDMKCELA